MLLTVFLAAPALIIMHKVFVAQVQCNKIISAGLLTLLLNIVVIVIVAHA
jgi:hypothetical protein